LNMLRRTPEKFVLAHDVDGVEKLVVREATKVDMTSGIRRVVPEQLEEWTKKNTKPDKVAQAIFEVEHPDTIAFLRTWKDINSSRVSKRMVLMNARGGQVGWDPDVIYAPPINTQKYPHFAFVKLKD